MKVTLERKNDFVLFDALNDDGVRIPIDGSEKIGGTGKGFRPMQLVLAGLAGCVSMDLVSILKKQKMDLQGLKITSSGTRIPEAVPSPFQSINLHFTFAGDIDLNRAEKAVALVIDRYCSVAEMLKPTVDITYTVSGNPS